MHEQLLIFPRDERSYLAWINTAQREVLVSAQMMQERGLCDVLQTLKARGVSIKALITDPYYFDLFAPDQIAQFHSVDVTMCHYSQRKMKKGQKNLFRLQQAGIYPHHINHQKFFLNHAKYVVIDGHSVFVGSSVCSRHAKIDVGVLSYDSERIATVSALFHADYGGKDVPSAVFSSPSVLVSTGGYKERVVQQLQGARESITLMMTTIPDDRLLINLLESKARSGVRLQVLCSPHVFGIGGADLKTMCDHYQILRLSSIGAEVRMVYAPLVHSKVLLIDGSELLVGSANWRVSSFESSRELAVMVTSPTVLQGFMSYFHEVWHRSVIYQ